MPKNILFPRFDTFGDIVLAQELIAGLMELFSDANITLLVREGYEQLAPMFPRGLDWLTTSINPYKDGIDKRKVNFLLQELRKRHYDLVLVTTFDRTWLDDVIVAALSSARRVMLGEGAQPEFGLTQVLEHIGIDIPETLYDSWVRVRERSHETEKYQSLFAWLKGENSALPGSALQIPDEVKNKARELISGFGLHGDRFVFCFPAGTATVSIKAWSEDNFARVIEHLEKRHSLKTLVAGHESEEEIVQEVVERAEKRGAHPKFWLGRDGDIPLACALANESLFYLGNDTGLMHMAAAVDKPVFAVFGGGHWPRFLPCAEKGRAFVCPMPCFYCKWDCFFDKPLCIDWLPAKRVIREIDRVLKKGMGKAGTFRIVEITPGKTQLQAFMEEAAMSLKDLREERNSLADQVKLLTEQLKESEADRAARLRQIDELTYRLKESEADRHARLDQVKNLERLLKESEADRAERLRQIEELTGWLKESEKDRSARLQVIEAQQADISGLKQALENLESSLVVRYGRKIGLIKAGGPDISRK